MSQAIPGSRIVAVNEIAVLIHRLGGNEDLPLPEYQTDEAVAMDLHAAVLEPTTLRPGEILLVPCGFAMAVPAGFEAQIRPRSGLAAKSGITVVNSPGTIDPDYRGEVRVGQEVFLEVESYPGERFVGRLARLNSAVDRASRTFLTRQ